MSVDVLDLSQNIADIVKKNFAGLYSGDLRVSNISGGQTAADMALANLNIKGYSSKRSHVFPVSTRGANVLSPYIRHNLLTLQQVHDAVGHAPVVDREKFRGELLWYEFNRHVYARLGVRMFEDLRFDVKTMLQGDGWNREMLCIDAVVNELETDGWLVSEARMWLASHWTVRNGVGWQIGQERMFRELLDGSRAANLLGWQWTVGAGTGKQYGFSKRQVEQRAPDLCSQCKLKTNCPIKKFPEKTSLPVLDHDLRLDHDADVCGTAGPIAAVFSREATHVLLTIDSLGDNDAALRANPQLPAVFVFNEVALKKLQLSSKRIAFYIQTLQDLNTRRPIQALMGDPYKFARDNAVAITHSPVPSFKKFVNLAEVHPYPWLRLPHAGSVRSFSSWLSGFTKAQRC